jgi:hypothetical protein
VRKLLAPVALGLLGSLYRMPGAIATHEQYFGYLYHPTGSPTSTYTHWSSPRCSIA